MNVARLNFSHGDHAEQQGKIDLIKKVREKEAAEEHNHENCDHKH